MNIKILIALIVGLGSVMFTSFLCGKVKVDKKSSYKVIKINGQILFSKTGKDLKRGDEFVPGTPFDFVTSVSRAAVVNKAVRYVLQKNNKGKVKVLPATSNVTSRSGALINLIDLQNHFSGRYLIFDNEKLQIGKEAFPMDLKHFFYVKFVHENETIAKQLAYHENYLLINKTELFKVDGKSISVEEKEMTLYYRDEVSKKSYKINSFVPVFPDLVELKEEIVLLLRELGAVSSERKLTEVTAYLNDFYGKPQKDNLTNWLEKEFSVKTEESINFK